LGAAGAAGGGDGVAAGIFAGDEEQSKVKLNGALTETGGKELERFRGRVSAVRANVSGPTSHFSLPP
jgi:hypothetical protein